jgi:hypothetical protein
MVDFYQQRIDDILKQVNPILAEATGHDDTHITCQPGDGVCICWSDPENSRLASENTPVSFLGCTLDELVEMDQGDMLDLLKKRSI